jgi:hypothetical protein
LHEVIDGGNFPAQDLFAELQNILSASLTAGFHDRCLLALIKPADAFMELRHPASIFVHEEVH